ncbi:DASH family cryptochrome [Mucilaginibacter sp. UR6-11]|uniref:DASH family cryptochrome n=1 Tax=Mucilaginibacter sp. UR6-11 TaxID=1435644 RepID=UPI001E53858F|nr:DASH family cryptochrome [Mucilaginibacter sp. UR6-11]MCC8426549.1 DASH family cryptochrome [Mucilaginibacter sp. UR6-11]
MSEKTILVWFRNDLRIHDNEILLEAVRKADKVLPVYCFDPYYFNTGANGAPKTGALRARFLLESVADLRKNLQALGGELIVRVGNPAEVLPQLATQYAVNEVYHHREVAYEETDISEQVETSLWNLKLNLKHFIGHTLYHKEDLPFPIKDIPDSFAVFKKKVERDSNVRPCIATPESIITPEITDAGELPTMQELGLSEPADDLRARIKFTGGETAGLARLEAYFTNNDQVAPTRGRNGATVDRSSKLAPWLSLGCISMRQVYWAVVKHEKANNVHNTGMLELELLWRDYFRFMFKKHGKQYFATDEQAKTTLAEKQSLFEKWKTGSTGVPFIDASMHKLNATGYISNFSRQMAAGYLVRDLEVDWRKGAAYFEEKLIDYSPASNWGNWAFIAGLGHDPRDNKYFNITKQVSELDTNSEFINTWAPADANIGQTVAI